MDFEIISYDAKTETLELRFEGIAREESDLVLANIATLRYPNTAIRNGWKDIDEERFHEIMANAVERWKVHHNENVGCFDGRWSTVYQYYTVSREGTMEFLLIKSVPFCDNFETRYREWI